MRPSSKKKKNEANNSALYGPLPSIEVVQERLEAIFPVAYPNRTKLVGQMSARVIFVFLYGGFVGKRGQYLRPAHVYFFTEEQALKVDETDRIEWVKSSGTQGFRPHGKRWYADTSKEVIRDDLMRYQYFPLGIVKKDLIGNHSHVSSKPVNYLDPNFASLFDPFLKDDEFILKSKKWRTVNLSTAARQRMALRAGNVVAKENDVYINMPDKTRMRISSGVSNVMARDLIEVFANRHLKNPLVLWLSASDKKSYPQFVEISSQVGLKFDLGAELPDVILGDLSNSTTFYLCEIVATDGAVTEPRREALLKLIRSSKIQEKSVKFISVFEDRDSGPFRKNFSQIALNTLIWFQTEPDLLVALTTKQRKNPNFKLNAS